MASTMPVLRLLLALAVDSRLPAGRVRRRPGREGAMRWQRLFDDLEAQIEAADAAELEAEVADRIRSEVGRLRMVDRLRGSLGEEIDVHLPSGVRERGVLTRVGADWLLLEPGAAQAGVGEMDALVPLRAVQTLGGLAARSMAPGSEG